jgi:hypothetical protein
MFDWLKRLWQGFLADRKFAREISPRSFLRMAEDIRDLARAAARIGPREPEFLVRIREIEDEMARLGELVGRPEFSRLPPDRRVALRQGLMQSREQLLETINTAPAPTRILQ